MASTGASNKAVLSGKFEIFGMSAPVRERSPARFRLAKIEEKTREVAGPVTEAGSKRLKEQHIERISVLSPVKEREAAAVFLSKRLRLRRPIFVVSVTPFLKYYNLQT